LILTTIKVLTEGVSLW